MSVCMGLGFDVGMVDMVGLWLCVGGFFFIGIRE